MNYELPEDVDNIIDWWWLGSPKNGFIKNMVYTGNLNGNMPNQNNMAGVHLIWLARCICKQRITEPIKVDNLIKNNQIPFKIRYM